MTNGSASGTQAVDRAALLVATVVQATGPLSFADLQEACDLPKSTTSRMLTALERSQLLERDDDGSYVAGSLFWLYAARHDPGEDLVRLAGPTLAAIGEETHETVNLSVARGDRVVQVAQVDSQFILGTRDWTQIDVPAHCSSLGKVFLAWDVVAAREPLERRTPASLMDMTSVRALPAKPGDVLCWNQAVLHWGSRTSRFAPAPRLSMALEFQRRDIPAWNTPLLDRFANHDFETRLKLVGKQILQYKHMYPLAERFQQLAEKLVA